MGVGWGSSVNGGRKRQMSGWGACEASPVPQRSAPDDQASAFRRATGEDPVELYSVPGGMILARADGGFYRNDGTGYRLIDEAAYRKGLEGAGGGTRLFPGGPGQDI
jgi:hypothetical protein